MAMFDVTKTVIETGRYKLSEMLRKIDTIWMQGDITDDERQSLVQMAKHDPDANAELDLAKKIEELDKRVAALEDGESGGGTEPEEYPEYVAGKWYYNGDKVNYNGKQYTCTAPSGVVCVWSPDEYPTYWEEVM